MRRKKVKKAEYPRYCQMLCGPHLKPCTFTYPHEGDCECRSKACREIAELKRSFYDNPPEIRILREKGKGKK